jgi:hypothetical protein
MQRRAELGSSSEEEATSSENSMSDNDSDSETDSLATPNRVISDEDKSVTPTSKSSAISPIPPKLDLYIDADDDLYDFSGAVDITESLEHLMQ